MCDARGVTAPEDDVHFHAKRLPGQMSLIHTAATRSFLMLSTGRLPVKLFAVRSLRAIR
jgi:hypothetical protein